MTALIDIDYFKSLPLGLKDNMIPEPDVLAEMIETASQQIENYTGRKFAPTQLTEYIAGSGSNRLILAQYPVMSLDSVVFEDAFGSHIVDPAHLWLDADLGILTWRSSLDGPFWKSGRYRVVYTAGYDPIPGPVKHATALQVTELLQPNFGGPQQNVPDIVPLSSQLIIDLLDPEYVRKRRIR
jgi:hypothetical protein